MRRVHRGGVDKACIDRSLGGRLLGDGGGSSEPLWS